MNDPTDTVRRYREKLAEAAKTIERLRAQLSSGGSQPPLPVPEPIAVVATALRMPGGADTPEEFWRLLRHGADATREFPASRADAQPFYHPDPDNRGTAYVIRGGFLDQVDGFDPAVFGISPREAVGMDPQQRIVLELAWEALERAGYPPTGLMGSRTGVYIGASTSDYVRMRQQVGRIEDIDGYQLIGEPSFIAGRVSYTLGLQGPSQVIDTTCSSALVAVHEACQALRQGECDLALAGGVNLMLSPYGFVLMSKFRALAPDGRCKTFDAAADGYARGEGAGLVVLKRLPDALAAQDTMLAVIRGSAVNHDGRSSGLTVPNPQAQQDVIRRALAQAGVDPAEVGYVEAHGTGTSLGDPIELGALDGVMGEGRDPALPLLVGSVKANIGHLEPAAGIAGLIKVILSLQHREIPPQLNLTTPNPKIPWRQLRIEVPGSLVPWPEPSGAGRLAGVSSFGASGTNAHLVVGEAGQAAPEINDDRRCNVLVLSARTGTALRELSARYAQHVLVSGQRFTDICFTSQVGRVQQAQGIAVVGDSGLDVSDQLARFSRGQTDARVTEVQLAPHQQRKTGWLFTGQGSQYAGMASGLRDDAAFAAAFAECQDLLEPMLARPLSDVLWGEAGSEIDDTRYAQPALFAVEYALGKALLSWGLRPAMLLGHSVGEIVAACLAGAIDLPDAALLIGHRARLMAGLPHDGAMVAVTCDETAAAAAIGDRTEQVSIAAVNGPSDVVLSGTREAVHAVAGELAAAGCRTHELTVSHAFHSPLLRPILRELGDVVKSIRIREPQIPLVSNVTGRPWSASELDPQYWVTHAADPVRFGDGLMQLHDHGVRTFLEVGPHPVLTGMGRRAIGDADCAWIGLLRRGRDDRAQVLRALGTLHLRGSLVNWPAVHPDRPKRVACPTYPWERERFWFRPAVSGSAHPGEAADRLGTRLRGPEPGFEQGVDEGPVTTAADALGWLVERSVRAATADKGGRWRRLSGVELDPALVHEARGPWLVQSVVREAADGAVGADTYGTSPEAARSGAAWRPHGRVVLHRTADERRSLPSASAAEPWLIGSGRAADEATAWGRIVAVASAALTDGADGWAYAFAEARCAAPGDVHHLQVVNRTADGDDHRADGLLCAEDGQVLGEIRELRSGPVPAPPPSRWEEDLVYRLTWTAAPDRGSVPSARPCRALVVGEEEGLALELRASGITCDVVCPASVPAEEEIDAWLDRCPTHIVLSGLAVPDGESLSADALTASALPTELTVVRLVQRIVARDWPAEAPRVILLTRGAVAAGLQQRRHNPAAATLWGLGRVIALEHPDCWGGAVDLDPGAAGVDAEAAAAGADAFAEPGEDQWALRDHRRYVARLRPVPSHVLPGPASRRPHRPGTVLITGGSGAIGTAVAQWLAKTGTERIVLASRTAMPAEQGWDAPGLDAGLRGRVDTVRRLREIGAEVETVALDVTDEAAVRALTERLATGPLPLRGVIHAAGVSAPQKLTEADPQTYRRVWAPKVVGAWLLHEATSELDLDLFVCFSSIAATWGSQHLASYAAANMFLDGLAHHRRARGLPCLAIDWGPWGLASDLFGDDVMAFLESTGLRRLHPPQCLSLLDRLLRAEEADYVVCAVDWNRYRPIMEARTDRPVLRDIAVTAEAEPEAQERALLDGLQAHRGATPEDRAVRAGLLSAFLTTVVAGALGVDPAQVGAAADVFALGMDSLMIMEVLSACRRGLGITLRPGDFFSRSNLTEWADHLDRTLLGEQTSGGDRPEEAAETVEAADAAGSTPGGDPFADVTAIMERAQLAPEIRPSSSGPASPEPDVILLTGATGYVGALLLDELLAATTARIVCLVRCASVDEGVDRIRRNLEHYRPWPAGAAARIEVLPGDLAKPRLGLSEPGFAAIADQAGAIYHAGAWVDFVHTFDQVAPANIGGTEEILRLAAVGRPKSVNNVSTYGIWGLPAQGRTRIDEAADIRTAGRLVTGYVQTKWGAEYLARQAQERGLPVRTFRLGRVLGDSRTGACLTTHFTCRVIKGCIQLGLAPDLDDLEIEMTPADYVARALVHISRSDVPDRVFHLVNGTKMRFNDLVRFMRRRGWPLRVVDKEKWWAALTQSVDAVPNELHAVMDIVREFVVGGEEAIDYDVTCAEKALAGSGISCPPLDERLLETYFDYFVRSGYLPKGTRDE